MMQVTASSVFGPAALRLGEAGTNTGIAKSVP